MSDFKINFVVHSPFPEYINYIGGGMVCHSLANDLVQLGENAYIYANSTKEDYSCGIIPWGTDLVFDKENTIVIFGAGADHIYDKQSLQSIDSIPNKVRWLVGDQWYNYSSEDRFYRYCSHFIPKPNQKVDGELASLDVDYSLFYNRGLQRKGSCVHTKGHNITKQYHPNDSILVDVVYNLPANQRMQFLSDLFNTTKYLYVYTHRSFTAVLAALCGCIVIVIPYDWSGIEIPIEGFDSEAWRSSLPTFKYGIACGVDDIDWAIETSALVKDNLLSYQEQITKNQKKFINDCYTWMKKKYEL